MVVLLLMMGLHFGGEGIPVDTYMGMETTSHAPESFFEKVEKYSIDQDYRNQLILKRSS